MTTEKQIHDALLIAATSCPHEIDHGRVVLHFDPKQPGHNALNQLGRRLASAQAQQEPLCPCEDRPASACDEQWGPQCDLGNNPAHVRVAPPVQQAEAARDVLAERQRQISAEGWTPEHDDEHSTGDMALGAAAYAIEAQALADGMQPSDTRAPPWCWPWAREWWKPTTPRRNLVKAGALILAEIERMDRAAEAAKGGD